MDYVLNDLKNRHVRENGDKLRYLHVLRGTQRFWLLLATFVSSVYIFLSRSIIIKLNGMIFNNNIFFCCLISIMIILWYYTGYEKPKDYTYGEKIIYRKYGQPILHGIFWVLGTVITCVASLLFMQVNFFTLMSDFFMDSGPIKIIIQYNHEEKMFFVSLSAISL